jgi:hypothetical protein
MSAAPESQQDDLQPATAGAGPLLQRDYWAVIAEARCTPSQVMDFVQTTFCSLPAADVVTFNHAGDRTRLDVGDEIDISILLAGACRVRVVHRDRCSVTLGTLQGHPEAGRITFGSYRNDAGDVIFHIRSRARSKSLIAYLGFLVGGDPMQTQTWTAFVDNVARACGSGVAGEVRAETLTVGDDEWLEADRTLNEPTFIARGD